MFGDAYESCFLAVFLARKASSRAPQTSPRQGNKQTKIPCPAVVVTSHAPSWSRARIYLFALSALSVVVIGGMVYNAVTATP